MLSVLIAKTSEFKFINLSCCSATAANSVGHTKEKFEL